MQNSNATIEKKEVKKITSTNSKTSKNGAKQPTAADKVKALEQQVTKLNDERYEFIADLTSLNEEQEELKKEAEKLELENATLKANIKHHEEELKIAAQNATEEAEKTIQLLKKQLEEAQKPSHTTAEEKLNRLTKANEISAILERRKESFQAFQDATTGDEQDIFKVIFECSDSTRFALANPEIVNSLILKTRNFMQNSITETEKELLSYQV